MRIESIKFNNKAFLPVRQENKSAPIIQDNRYHDSSSLKTHYYPHFSANPNQVLPMGLNFKKAKNIRCLYCGKEMISAKVFHNLFDFEFDSNERTSESFLKYAKSNFHTLSESAKRIVQKFEKDYKEYPDDSLRGHLRAIKYQKDPMIESMLIDKKTFTQKAVGVIRRYQKILPPVQTRALEKVEAALKANPNKRLTEIMADLRPKYLQTLTNRQNAIIENMELLTDIFSLQPQYRKQFIEGNFSEDFAQRIESVPNKISPEFKANIKEILEKAKTRTDIVSEDPFKRKAFIEDIDKMSVKPEEEPMREAIRDIATSMPSSTTSLSAFMVKYSGMTNKISIKAANKIMEDGFSKPEKELLERVKKKYSKVYQEEGLNALIAKIYPQNLIALKNSRADLLELMNDKISAVQKEFEKSVSKLASKGRELISQKSVFPSSIKDELNSGVDELRGKIHSEHLDYLRKKVLSLPSTTNDTDAFIVQYKEMLPNKSGIENFEMMLSKKEKDVFNLVKAKYLGIEDNSLKQNVQKNYQSIFESLLKKQVAVVEDIGIFANTATLPFVQRANQIVQTLENVFIHEPANFSMQQKILTRFKETKIPVSSHKTGFHSFVDRLPTSEDDVNAFVVKCFDSISKSKVRQNNMRPRTDKEVAEAFLSQLVETEEHVKPRITWAKDDPEKNRADNLALAHKRCNESRSCESLKETVQKEPMVAKYYQNYLDDIVRNLKEGNIDSSYNLYPKFFSERAYSESGGLIKLKYPPIKNN